jgi:hypothetical protein
LFASPLALTGRAFQWRGVVLGGRDRRFVAVEELDIEMRAINHLGRSAQGFAVVVAHQCEAPRQNLGITKTAEQFFQAINIRLASRDASIPAVPHAFRQTVEMNAGIAHKSDARRSGTAKPRGKVVQALLPSVSAYGPATLQPVL